MAAALLLVAGMLFDLLADGFLVGNAGPAVRHGDVVFIGQLLTRDGEVNLTLAMQHQFVGVGIVFDAVGRIFFDQLGQRRRQFHLVVAPLHLDRDGIDRRQRAVPRIAALAAARQGQNIAGRHLFEAAQRHHVARAGAVDLGLVMAEHAEQAADALAAQLHAVAYLARPNPRMAQLARARLRGFEHLDHRVAARFEAATRRGRRRARRIVAQRFPQPEHAALNFAGADHHRHDIVGRQILDELTVDILFVRHHVLEQLLEQVVVEIRQRFEQLLARHGLRVGQFGRHFDNRRGLALLVLIGALADQVDIAGGLVAVADRHVAQNQR